MRLQLWGGAPTSALDKEKIKLGRNPLVPAQALSQCGTPHKTKDEHVHLFWWHISLVPLCSGGDIFNEYLIFFSPVIKYDMWCIT